ncbi:MAG: acyltransferase [Gemmatimonadetes bacterium]|nr:acyltransferase [Gemmatimonadota bacterium]
MATAPVVRQEVRVVTLLRGLAALAVGIYHLTNMDYLSGTLLRRAGSVGWMGVESFFVISGFVIPYAMATAGYSSDRFGNFLLRRIVRIDPPYLASMALCMGLAYASAAFRLGNAAWPDYSVGQVLANVGYLNNFLGYTQINRVFWTLGIEFQYYILIGAFHAAITRGSWTVTGPVLVAGIVLDRLVQQTAIHPTHVISHWVPLFLMGIAVASHRLGRLSTNGLLLKLAVFAAAAVIELSTGIMLVALATALLIAFLPDLTSAPLAWLGRVSYSLYLVHVPIGERAMNLVQRLHPPPLVGLLVALGATLAASWIFFRLIEEPARRWASAVGRGKPVPGAPAPA